MTVSPGPMMSALGLLVVVRQVSVAGQSAFEVQVISVEMLHRRVPALTQVELVRDQPAGTVSDTT